MKKNDPPQTVQLARFALRKHALPAAQREQLQRHLLDSLGSLLFSLDQATPQKLRRQIAGMAEGGPCSVPLLGAIAFDRAAQWLTALIRYPDFMDNYLGREATCHPSDNIGSLLAAGLLADSSGTQFLEAMAVSYQIECRLIDEFPVMKNGFDHTVLLAHSQTAGMARLLSLSEDQAANALGIVGCSFLSLAAGRASYTTEWKGFASALSALGCANAVLLAAHDLTGPRTIFEGPAGYEKALKMKLRHDWSNERFDLIPRCILKRFNAEVHSQSVLAAVLALREEHGLALEEVESVDVAVFRTCVDIIGNGEYGDRTDVRSKEQADHSLPYLIAVALADGDVMPEQLEPTRIQRPDVQRMLKKIKIHTVLPSKLPEAIQERLDPLTQDYPDWLRTKVKIDLKNGKTLQREERDYPGFFTRPFDWEQVEGKFRRLSRGALSSEVQAGVIRAVRNLPSIKVGELVASLCATSG